MSTVSFVFAPFPSVSPAPDFPNPDYVSISWSKVCTREVTNAVSGPGGPGTHFLALEAQVGETGFLVTFLRPVSGSVSRHVKNPQSGKIREVSGKVSGKSNNKSQRVGTRIKNGRHIYIYIYIYIYILV